MIRAFAIGLAVATIRPIIGLFFVSSRLSGLTPDRFFGIAFASTAESPRGCSHAVVDPVDFGRCRTTTRCQRENE